MPLSALRTRIAALITMAFLAIGSMYAQRDTSNPGYTIYGPLVQASSSEIQVETWDPSGSMVTTTIGIDNQTVVEGCTLAEVRVGTMTYVSVSDPSTSPVIADYVQFDGCEPSWSVSARVRWVTPTVAQFETSAWSALGDSGTVIDVAITSETSVITCSGVPLSIIDLDTNALVFVAGRGQGTNLTAFSITRQDDCPQTLYVDATFVSFADSVLTVDVTATSERLALKISDRFGYPIGDSSLPIYRCDGMTIDVATLVAGDQMNVVYLAIPNEGDFLQYASVTKDCPITITGTITNIANNVVTIVAQGQSYEVTVSDDTKIGDCRGNFLSATDLVVGMLVQAEILADNNTSSALSIAVLDGCPYAFYAYGVVTSVSGSSFTLEGQGSESLHQTTELTLQIDDASMVFNCLHEPRTIDALNGASVTVYYRIDQGVRIADIAVITDPCDAGYLSGTIMSADSTTIVVNSYDGTTVTLSYGADSKISDCMGAPLEISASLIGKGIYANISSSSTPAYITSATIDVGCATISTVGGTVMTVTDSALTLQGADGMLYSFNRSQYTAVYNNMQVPQEWLAITMGDTVCCTYDANTYLLYRVFLDANCWEVDPNVGRTAPIMGTIISMEDADLTIETRGGVMSFAVSSATQLMRADNSAVTTADMVPGATVGVVSTNFMADGQPVAETVMLMTPTSVDNEMSSTPVLHVFPNPASHNVTISGAGDGDRLLIFDQHGTRVATSTTPTMSVTNLAPGVYTVVRRSLTGATNTGRLVIVR